MDFLRKRALYYIEKLENNTNRDEKKLKKYCLIFKLLKDDDCFFKISKEDAYQLLCHLGVENPQKYYLELISVDNYKKIKKGVVDEIC